MNKQQKKQNRSMFLYTALIFAVALILIIIAFFGQTNISNLRRSAEQANAPVKETQKTEETQKPQASQDTLAQLGNAVSSLEAENNKLKADIKVYERLIKANSYISTGDHEAAKSEIESIDPDNLTGEQKILYEQINNQIEEKTRKEQ